MVSIGCAGCPPRSYLPRPCAPQELRTIDLSHNGLDGAVVTDTNLGAILPDCRHLTSLNFSANPLREVGALAIARAALRCRRLTVVNLGNCHVSECVLVLVLRV